MQHETTRTDSGLPYRHSVGMCLFNDKGQVFCAERRDKRGAWQMPQGGIQKGEDPAIALFREMKEEIGTDKAEIIGVMPRRVRYEFPDYLQYKQGVFRGKYRGQEQLWYALRFLGQDSDINLLGESDPEWPEFVAWKWIELSELANLIVPFKKPVYDEVIATFLPLVSAVREGQTKPIKPSGSF